MMWLKGCLSELKLDKGEAMAVGMNNKSAKMFAEEYMVQNIRRIYFAVLVYLDID